MPRFLCFVLFCAVSLSQAWAELPLARLLTIFPPGGKIGTSFEVTLSGVDLDNASQLHFSNAGIVATQAVSAVTASDSAKFKVTIGTNVPPGIYEARVFGRFGISNSRGFAVGNLSEASSSGHNGLTNAQPISIETTVNAAATATASDFFEFKAQSGQRILIECQTKALDSKMDPVLILFDSQGKELSRNRAGGLLDFTAPNEGAYVIQVHDLLFRGGKEYFYRLSLSCRPHIDFIFPPSGLPGAKTSLTIYGRNLPGGEAASGLTIGGKPLEKLAAEIEFPRSGEWRERSASSLLGRAAEAAVESNDYRLSTTNGPSEPEPLFLANATPIAEREPNNKPPDIQQIAPPCEIQGQFYPANDVDSFQFEAKKDEIYWIELFSQRLGVPSDAFVLVQRVRKDKAGQEKTEDLQEVYDSEGNVGGVDYPTSSGDPVWRFAVKEDGTYRVQVRDLFNRAPDPSRIYRLSIRREAPDFRLLALILPPPSFEKDKRLAFVWTPFLRRQDTLLIKVLALRRDNLTSDIELNIDGLPPGVVVSPQTIRSGQNTAYLSLTANETAGDWFGALKVIGKARLGTNEISHEALGTMVAWDVPDYANEAIQSRLTRDCLLSTAGETVPFSVEPAEKKTWQAPVAGKLQIPLKLDRRGEFNEAVKLRAYVDSQNDPIKEWDAVGKATNTVLELDLGQAKISAGPHSLFVLAQTKGNYYRLRPDELAALKQAPKNAENEKQMAPQGRTATFVSPLIPLSVAPASAATAIGGGTVASQ